jgi:hypothetical protein
LLKMTWSGLCAIAFPTRPISLPIALRSASVRSNVCFASKYSSALILPSPLERAESERRLDHGIQICDAEDASDSMLAAALTSRELRCRPGRQPRPNHFRVLADFLNFRFLRQRKKRRAAKLKSGSVRLPVHQPLAFDAADCRKRAVNVADAERNAVIVAKLVFGQVAM